MIKLPEKDSFSPAELARAVGKHCATIWRWMVRGVRGHRLASYRLGGQRRIAREDILAFIEAINSDTAINGSAKGETPRRAEEVRRVEDELDRLGI